MTKQTLLDTINQDLKEAMRNKDETAKLALRSIKTGIMEAERAGKTLRTLNDQEIQQVIARLAKQRKDAIEQYEKGGRADLAAAEKAELAVLERYLPQPLTEEELEAIVRAAIQETGASSARDLGQVMRVAMGRVAGRADGRAVNQVARRLLGS